MFNRKFSSNIRRKKRMITSIIILLVVSLGIGYSAFTIDLSINGTLNVSKYDHTLYGVLEKAAKKGTYAKEYTGEHHDSFTEEPTKKIYHWYAPSTTAGNTLANEILDKNNVMFADHCWQMIRTTDTGGVKMIYNGEAENNQCLNTRGNHVGYSSMTTQFMSTTYYYGTSYKYDKTNSVFSLDGTVTTGTIQTGQYTCKSISSAGTCETLYLVDSFKGSGTEYYVFPLNGSTDYSLIGKVKYNPGDNSYAYTGYMYNNVYTIDTYRAPYFYIQDGIKSIDLSHYYSDSIDYNNLNANQYTLVNPIQISTLVDYSELVGKYIVDQSGISSNKAGYVVSVDNDKIYYRTLHSGDLVTSMVIGDSYVNNSNGTYTLENPTLLKFEDWYNGDYSLYKNKYCCYGTSETCTNIVHIIDSNCSKNHYLYWSSDDTYKFCSNVNYDGNKYTLTDDIIDVWDISKELNNLSTHHYTCLNNQISCENISYVSYYSSGTLLHITFNGLPNIETVLKDMLSSENVNQTSSIAKKTIDAWYKRYLISYTNKLEDIIFCNDRSISNLGGYNSNGGIIIDGSNVSNLYFNGYKSTSIDCINETDKFSVANSKAKLVYKIGLMTVPEAKLTNNRIIIKNGSSYYLLSPLYFYSYVHTIIMGSVNSAGEINSSGMGYIYMVNGIRPAISLKPGTEYVSGSGSMADPYIVE